MLKRQIKNPKHENTNTVTAISLINLLFSLDKCILTPLRELCVNVLKSVVMCNMAGQRNDTPESIVFQRGQLQTLTSIYDFVKIFLGISFSRNDLTSTPGYCSIIDVEYP